MLSVRLRGAQAAVHAACTRLGGELLADEEAASFWDMLREQRLEFFAGDAPLWRLSLPSITPPLDLPAPLLIEWHGAQRWLRGELPRGVIVAALEKVGAGEATALQGGQAKNAFLAVADGNTAANRAVSAFRGGDRAAGVFAPLSPALMQIHRRLKQAFDPHRIFNPGRLYPEL
jgi:glycolate oxidase FAD binding subunit